MEHFSASSTESQNVVGPILALPRSHRSAFQSAKNKENRDLGSQSPQSFLACGAASRSLQAWRTEISYFAQMLRFMVNPLLCSLSRVRHTLWTHEVAGLPPGQTGLPTSLTQGVELDVCSLSRRVSTLCLHCVSWTLTRHTSRLAALSARGVSCHCFACGSAEFR